MADKVTLTKAAVTFIVAGLVAAFGAGTVVSSKVFGEAQAREAKVLAAGIGPVADVAAAAVTAEQVRQLAQAMGALQTKLDDTIKQVSDLNARLARIEGAQAEAAASRHP